MSPYQPIECEVMLKSQLEKGKPQTIQSDFPVLPVVREQFKALEPHESFTNTHFVF